MTAKIVSLKIVGGQDLLVEVDEPATTGVKPVGIGPRGEIDFAGALNNIKSAAAQLRETLASLATPPDNCEISFGIKFSASAGVILAKAGTEANFQIKMSWAKEK